MKGFGIFLAVVGAVASAVALFFFLPLLGALVGAFVGWVVGWFFSDTIYSTLTAFGVVGVRDLAMWQIGLALGFIGGFFKSSQTNTNK